MRRSPDAADDWIAERAQRGDIIVTADVPLAARGVKAGADVIGPTGQAFSEASIGMTLASRNLMDDLRSSGMITGGPKPFTQRDRSTFLSALDLAIVRLKRAGFEVSKSHRTARRAPSSRPPCPTPLVPPSSSCRLRSASTSSRANLGRHGRRLWHRRKPHRPGFTHAERTVEPRRATARTEQAAGPGHRRSAAPRPRSRTATSPEKPARWDDPAAAGSATAPQSPACGGRSPRRPRTAREYRRCRAPALFSELKTAGREQHQYAAGGQRGGWPDRNTIRPTARPRHPASVCAARARVMHSVSGSR